MVALNSTVASVPARDYVLLLTDTNARIGKTGEGRGRWGSRQQTVGRIWPRLAQSKRQTASRFLRRHRAHSSEQIVLYPKRVLHVPKCQPQKGTNTFGLYPDKVDGPSTDPLR